MTDSRFRIRAAEVSDIPIILMLIRELAVYEKLEQEVIATEEMLKDHLFEKKSCFCLIASEGQENIGFALYFYNFSTFAGRKGLYLEDLFIKPAFRGIGYGKALLLELKSIAQKEECARMEWAVLNWNTPAIDFYKGLGARAMNDWILFRMSGDALHK
ncbi:MAG TPA: GNAT family N-acetyltransferase [Chitinophagaceae bacterium]|nr:GNAT family N-acetyltransferase [Chitinophagaceae bacterium]HNF71295.1 GNAT family N-acetyltransferase [Chitinophagaceae bacterium]